ncbi:hypothetical protein AUF78_17095 [archaeon 13_1_20CM_2_51_12]|nr:MAG: hypothetical protein AUF78_17095 [archaeon 13_1_20CM_2_51_12]
MLKLGLSSLPNLLVVGMKVAIALFQTILHAASKNEKTLKNAWTDEGRRKTSRRMETSTGGVFRNLTSDG